jgi:hypothetical protein
MRDPGSRLADRARTTLGVVRLINGALGLLAPGVLVRRLGGEATASPVARYAFRLFGVRTILLGAELLLPNGPVRDQARRTAVIVHAADTAAAAWGAWRRELPPRIAMATVAISAINTLLALLARPRSTQPSIAMPAAPRTTSRRETSIAAAQGIP